MKEKISAEVRSRVKGADVIVGKVKQRREHVRM